MNKPAWLLAGAAALAIASLSWPQARADVVTDLSRARGDVASLERGATLHQDMGQAVDSGLPARVDGFTGTVRFDVIRPGRSPDKVVYTIDGGEVRYDVLGARGQSAAYAVADLPGRKAFAVLHRSGEVEAVAPITGPGDPARNLDDAVVLRRPDKTDHVAGRLCETWRISTADHDVDVCAASGIAWFDLVPRWSSDHVQPRWSAELSRDGYFPLRVIVKDKRGHEELRMVATQVQKKPVDDSVFRLSAQSRVVAALPGHSLPSAT